MDFSFDALEHVTLEDIMFASSIMEAPGKAVKRSASVCVAPVESTERSALVASVLELGETPAVMFDVTGMGPGKAACALQESLPTNESMRRQWLERAAISAVMGSCPKSRKSFMAGASV